MWWCVQPLPRNEQRRGWWERQGQGQAPFAAVLGCADSRVAPELAFDHNTIVDYALWRLRTKLEYSRIAQAFLGPEFTLAELRQVYEAVLQKPLDPANFRRQVESTAGIIATEQRKTGGRHRPPRVYRYDSSVALTDNGPLTSTSTREA